LLRDLPTPELARDYDLALVALAGSSSSTPTAAPNAEVERKRDNLIGLYDVNNSDHVVFWTDFAAWVRNQVSFSLVLGRIMSSASGGSKESTCRLGMLNQGDSTSLTHMKLIAECIGIPMGQDSGALCQTLANLQQ
jgi:hypothetical protein